MEADIVKQLAALDQRGRSNTHRLDALERLAAEIHEQGKNIALMVAEMQHTNEHIDALGERVSGLEKRPGALWDKFIGGVVGAVATGLVAAVLAVVLK